MSWRAPRAGARRHARAASPARGAPRRRSSTRTGRAARRASSSSSSTTDEKRFSPARCGTASRSTSVAGPQGVAVFVMETTVVARSATRGKRALSRMCEISEAQVCRARRRPISTDGDPSPASCCSRRSPRCSPRRPASAAAPADAATGVKYGITDDAWLQSGPGTLAVETGAVARTRSQGRPLHAQLEPDRAGRARLRPATRRTPPTTGARSIRCWTGCTRAGSRSSCS